MQEALHSENLKGELQMKRFLFTLALAFSLSGQVLAGDIPSGGIAPPPPPDEIQASPGEIPTGGVAGQIPCDGLAQQAEDAALAGFLTVLGWLT
jgi:hypothetical protein